MALGPRVPLPDTAKHGPPELSRDRFTCKAAVPKSGPMALPRTGTRNQTGDVRYGLRLIR